MRNLTPEQLKKCEKYFEELISELVNTHNAIQQAFLEEAGISENDIESVFAIEVEVEVNFKEVVLKTKEEFLGK